MNVAATPAPKRVNSNYAAPAIDEGACSQPCNIQKIAVRHLMAVRVAKFSFLFLVSSLDGRRTASLLRQKTVACKRCGDRPNSGGIEGFR